MRFTHIDHIAIAVHDLDAAVATYQRLYNAPPVHRSTVPSEGVAVAMFAVPPTNIELLAPLDAASPVAAFLQRRGQGLHHIAYAVADLDVATAQLIAEGFGAIPRPTTIGAGGHAIQFFHPRDLHGVLTELIQQ